MEFRKKKGVGACKKICWRRNIGKGVSEVTKGGRRELGGGKMVMEGRKEDNEEV